MWRSPIQPNSDNRPSEGSGAPRRLGLPPPVVAPAGLGGVPADRAKAMRMTATALLVLMAGVLIVGLQVEDRHPAGGYVVSFAGAAMVGGLADWFAVTALFRRPPGLPIPHTAIIPEKKDRIADTMAGFLRDNFLTPGVVARRMRDMKDRKSTRLNSSHVKISYAVFCL